MMSKFWDQFLKARIVGYLFHWKQVIRRRIKKLKLYEEQLKIAIIKNYLDVFKIISKDETQTKGIPCAKDALLSAEMTKQDETK